MSQFSTVRFNANNDNNGNPRRVFVTLKNGNIVATYDEGYNGEQAITNRYHKAAYVGITFICSPSEYKELINI